MNAEDFTVQYKLDFLTNAGHHDEQPIFTLLRDEAVTGGDFITLYRRRKSRFSGVSGDLILEVSSPNGVSSVTGTSAIKAESIKNGTSAAYEVFGTTANHTAGTTAGTQQYTINTVMEDDKKLNVITWDQSKIFGGMTLTSSSFGYGTFEYIGVGHRPFDGDPAPQAATSSGTSGTGGQIALYLFNRNEGASDRGSVWNQGTISTANSRIIYDRGGYDLKMDVSGSLSSDAITGSSYSPQPSVFANNNNPGGWSAGPTEGAFRFNGGIMLQSVSSQLFNSVNIPDDYGADVTRDYTTSALSVLTWVNVGQTGSASASHIFSIGTSADPSGAIDNTILRVSQTSISANVVVGSTATSLSTSLYVQNIGGENRGNLGEWHHLAVTMQSEVAKDSSANDMTRPGSGVHVFINGWEVLSAATTAHFLTMSGVERPVLRMGGVFANLDDLDTVVSGLTGAIGMTRLFNRSLSGAEIRQNYLSSLPALYRLNQIAIA